MLYRGHGVITVPKGTLLTHHTACGFNSDYNFVADLSWIPAHEDGTPQHGLIHDAKYYGINIPPQYTTGV